VSQERMTVLIAVMCANAHEHADMERYRFVYINARHVDSILISRVISLYYRLPASVVDQPLPARERPGVFIVGDYVVE